jgi:hypothetical protein
MTETKTSVKELTNTELEEIQKLAEQKKEANIVPVELAPEEEQEIKETFENVKDFRTL